MFVRSSPWRFLVASAVVSGWVIGPLGSPTYASDPAQGEPAAGASTKDGFPNPELARLDRYIGSWKVTEIHFDERGEAIHAAKGTEKITWILDQHAIQRDYHSSTDTTAFEAIGTLTYNQAAKQYQGVWFDNARTTGPSTVGAVWNEAEEALEYTTEARAEDGSMVRYKTVETFSSEELRVATTYRIEGAASVKCLKVQYKRAQPCPGKIRVIRDF